MGGSGCGGGPGGRGLCRRSDEGDEGAGGRAEQGRSGREEEDQHGRDGRAEQSPAVAAGVLTARQSAALQKASAEEEAEETERQLAALLHLRGLLWPVLDALTEGEPPPAEEWNALRRVILRARESAELPAAFPLRWQPGTERLADLGHTLALQAEALLAGPGLERIRRCGGPGCGWFFLDRSRGGTRRWCSSGDCGNRDRARRHFARSKQAR
ncbi:CGNR zinc finger domain-containing protein [Streptomyces sp. NPDC055721]|uniref:CGNR zinc finger domain-containing protein n=1 Tax=Streptomyces sp. NPDC127132 TaxID=3345374 RepID=UPI00363C61D2